MCPKNKTSHISAVLDLEGKLDDAESLPNLAIIFQQIHYAACRLCTTCLAPCQQALRSMQHTVYHEVM